jgi:hypothetical protein
MHGSAHLIAGQTSNVDFLRFREFSFPWEKAKIFAKKASKTNFMAIKENV